MAMLEDVADSLAKRTLDLIARTGDEMLEARVADAIGASSPTLQEAYSTAMRIRKAEIRGKVLLDSIAADLAPEETEEPIVLPPPSD